MASASLLNVLVIGVALALPLGGYVLLANLKAFSRDIATDPQISVFLTVDAEIHNSLSHFRPVRPHNLGDADGIYLLSRSQGDFRGLPVFRRGLRRRFFNIHILYRYFYASDYA